MRFASQNTDYHIGMEDNKKLHKSERTFIMELAEICQKYCTIKNRICYVAYEGRIDDRKTAETINMVCAELGTTEADLAKRMGMFPSSLCRKRARESMTFEELQKCLDVLGVTVEFELRSPDGRIRSSQANHELLLERMNLREKELEAARKAEDFHKIVRS